MHTTAATVRAVSIAGGPVQPEDQEDQAGQQQRGDRHARRSGSTTSRPRRSAGRHGDEQEAEQQDHHGAEQALDSSGPVPADGTARQDQHQRRGCRRARRVIGRSRSVRGACRSRAAARLARRSRKPGDDRAEDQRQRPAHADDAAGRHRPGADVAQVVALDVVRAPCCGSGRGPSRPSARRRPTSAGGDRLGRASRRRWRSPARARSTTAPPRPSSGRRSAGR